jgi:rifampicin phosphotransferase
MTTSTTVRRLRDVRLTDAPEVGGKAAGIGELVAAGARVPDGMVLTSSAENLTAEERRGLLAAVVRDLGSGPFAVRSSGVSEDGTGRSFAGMFETVLGVAPEELPAATESVLGSNQADRVAGYGSEGNGRMAVIIQRMVAPVAAGVAFTADPVTGDRRSVVITAVRGLGERLVSGAAIGDEWVVRDGRASARRQSEHVLDARQAVSLAQEVSRIAGLRDGPQDVEWAIDADGTVWLLQARPMTALPPEVSWESPASGAYTRQYRFGEWIGEPVTPLFESWLLIRLEEGLHAKLKAEIGQRAPLPHHVIVNGWYFYSLNWFSPSSLLRSLPSMVAHGVREPRKLAGILPPLVRYAVPPLEREWRAEVQPRYRAEMAEASGQVETLSVAELPALIDHLADLAGEYSMWVAALGGAAYKLEINLARFYRRHLAPTLGGSHLPLLSGIQAPTDPGRHALVSLDWWHEPSPLAGASAPPRDHDRLVATRRKAEETAVAVLAHSPRRLRAFRELLAEAQRLIPIREEQMLEWTLPWPIMRRAVVRIGEALVERGVLTDPDDVFFLTRAETLAALGGEPLGPAIDVAGRRAARVEHARLVPPTFVGNVNRAFRAMPGAFARMVGARPSERALVSGSPASPGTASGLVRVVRGPDDFDSLQPGEILVAPLTAPAWTPLFSRAAAVVTDVGSAAAHASIIAREYGIPAVVGCGDATARLRNGMLVTVDGSTGNVEPG